MKIKILGTRGEIEEKSPYHTKQSGILIDDELLIDLGEKSYLKSCPKWILITHLHPDHAFFVRRGKKEALKTDAQVYAPELSNKSSLVQILNKKKKIGPYIVIPIPTHHSKHVKSQAYVIKKGGVAFLYTGDLIWINKKHHPRIGQVDLVITEASFVREGGMIRRDKETGILFGHNGVPNLIKLLKPFSKTILFMHFGSWFYKNIKNSRKRLQQLGREQEIKVLVGCDGMVVDLKKIQKSSNSN